MNNWSTKQIVTVIAAIFFGIGCIIYPVFAVAAFESVANIVLYCLVAITGTGGGALVAARRGAKVAMWILSFVTLLILVLSIGWVLSFAMGSVAGVAVCATFLILLLTIPLFATSWINGKANSGLGFIYLVLLLSGMMAIAWPALISSPAGRVFVLMVAIVSLSWYVVGMVMGRSSYIPHILVASAITLLAVARIVGLVDFSSAFPTSGRATSAAKHTITLKINQLASKMEVDDMHGEVAKEAFIYDGDLGSDNVLHGAHKRLDKAGKPIRLCPGKDMLVMDPSIPLYLPERSPQHLVIVNEGNELGESVDDESIKPGFVVYDSFEFHGHYEPRNRHWLRDVMVAIVVFGILLAVVGLSTNSFVNRPFRSAGLKFAVGTAGLIAFLLLFVAAMYTIHGAYESGRDQIVPYTVTATSGPCPCNTPEYKNAGKVASGSTASSSSYTTAPAVAHTPAVFFEKQITIPANVCKYDPPELPTLTAGTIVHITHVSGEWSNTEGKGNIWSDGRQGQVWPNLVVPDGGLRTLVGMINGNGFVVGTNYTGSVGSGRLLLFQNDVRPNFTKEEVYDDNPGFLVVVVQFSR